MNSTSAYKWSRYSFALCAVLLCYASFFFYPRWRHSGSEATISWDVSGYYWYLPSAFIYKDLKHQSFRDEVLQKYRPTNSEFQQGMQLENGNYVMKYSSGLAVMYLPFFAVAHLLAGPLGYPKDGFSLPYQLAIQLGGLLVSLIGLWYLRKLLLQFYSDVVTAVTLLLLVLGTNYLNYAGIECGMSHCWLFTVYVFILLNTINFYKAFQLKYAVRIGLLVGLATLTRPTDMVSCLIPLLWGMERLTPSAIKQQFLLLLKNFKALAAAGICAAAVISIQLIYWKYVSGHWLVYSYQGQHIYLRSPNFENYTFSYRSGWLTYSPMMILAFIGIVPFLFTGKNKVAIVTFFLVNYYIVCSWNIWWYGGRAMVQSYPVLLFCVAALVQAAFARRAVMWLVAPVACVFLYFNTWITYTYHRGSIWDNDCMSEAYFWHVAGRWNLPENTVLLKENPEVFTGVPSQPQLIYRNDFAHEQGDFFVAHANDSAKSMRLDKEHQNSPVFKFAFAGNGARWLRAQAVFHCDRKEWEWSNMAQFIVRIMNKGTVVKENMERVFRVLDDGDTKTIQLDMKLPPVPFDSVNILFWNSNSVQTLWMDDLEVRSFSN